MSVKKSNKRKIMYRLLLVLGLFMLFIIAGAGSVKLLARTIYNSNGCERFNIDNIELRTGIDIPAFDEEQCIFDTISHSKKARFVVDRKKVNMLRYLERNHFGPMPAGQSPDKDMILPAGDTVLQFARGSHRDGHWHAFLQPASGVLWVQIDFRGR